MKIDLAFRNSSKIVLRFFGINIIEKEASEDYLSNYEANFSSYVGITGNPAGLISLEMKKETVTDLCSFIINKKMTAITDITKEILREITNEICGNAVTELWQYGYDSNITPPSVISGDRIRIYHSRRCKESFFLFSSDFGEIVLKTFLELK